jgi:hypothetical protein
MNLVLASLLYAAIAAKVPEANPSRIETLPVPRTPESNAIILKIPVPKPGQIVDNPVWLQFRIDGFALGVASSQFDRASEVPQTDMGQTVHVIIDDEPYFPINEPALDPFNQNSDYFDMSYKFKIPYRLSSGMHTVRMFPARSFGESLKGSNTFAALNFYVGSQKGGGGIDLSKPYLTYNEPSSLMNWTSDKPVLLDFYICNAELSPNGYKVRLYIDGKANSVLTSWQPYYIIGLKKGSHTIRLELIDSDNKPVEGKFNDVKQTIEVN